MSEKTTNPPKICRWFRNPSDHFRPTFTGHCYNSDRFSCACPFKEEDQEQKCQGYYEPPCEHPEERVEASLSFTGIYCWECGQYLDKDHNPVNVMEWQENQAQA